MRPSLAWCSVLLVLGVACERKHEADPAPSTSASASVASALPGASEVPRFDRTQLALFAPIPEGVEHPVVDDTVKLGRMLYYEARLSKDNELSCASCHDLDRAGMDGRPVSIGPKQTTGQRNTPTLINAAGANLLGWDARAWPLEAYIAPHFFARDVMAVKNELELDGELMGIAAYAAAFRKVFPEDRPLITSASIARALAAYVSKLFARSRWDRYLAGDPSALTQEELGGVAMFVEAGCVSCHQGKYLGGSLSQRLGIAKPWPGPAGADPGRFALTHQEADRGLFRVPSLRNVTRTAPYLHDGSVATLEEVVRLMARHQAGRELTPPQVSAIVAFLGTLTGDPDPVLREKPTLPPRTARPAKPLPPP